MQLFDLPIFLQGIIRRYRVVIFQTWFMGSSSRRFLKRFLAKKLRLASRNAKKTNIIGCHGESPLVIEGPALANSTMTGFQWLSRV